MDRRTFARHAMQAVTASLLPRFASDPATELRRAREQALKARTAAAG